MAGIGVHDSGTGVHDQRNTHFDTYAGDPASTQHSEADWTLLSVLAERVLDLKHQSLR